MPDADVAAIFTEKRAYLEQYQADWLPWLDKMKADWQALDIDLLAELKSWWEPLLDMAPTLRSMVGANVLINASDVAILIDFPRGEIRPHAGEAFSFRFDIPRDLVEAVAAARAVDWSNSLLLSCRFTAWRDGEFNEYVYNFLKSLSRERMRRAEAEVVRKLELAAGGGDRSDEPDIEVSGYVVQRRCPHRDADLQAFGEVQDGEFVCTLHGWRFDCETGACLTSPTEASLRIRRA
jgi:UDP-MurNAc hydroxylase